LAVDQDNVSKILSVLSHSLRRDILIILSEHGECSFTDLMNALVVDTGKLSFHIRSLEPFLEQTPTGRYKLNKMGENAIRLIKGVETWAEEVPVAAKASSLPVASFRKRTLAFLIDFLMIAAVSALITLPETFSLILGVSQIQDVYTLFVLTIALFWGYSTLLEGFVGQSLGKRVVGLRVVRTDGKKLSYEHAAVRNFGKAFLLPFDLLFGLRIKDDRFLRYFDKFAGTTVIDLKA
jgi:uncharacterized RDD family membrane protein YckC/DNA-binding transcriptional ArsR family regulator